MPYTHYTIDERKRTSGSTLQAMTGMGLPKDVISGILGKDLSRVYRELNRNSGEGIYTGREAHYEAETRRREAKDSPKMNDPLLMGIVMDLFKKDYSPNQIAGRLKREYPGNPEMRVSHETIYQEMSKEPELKSHFRHPRTKSGRKERRGQIPDRNRIENRPAIVNEADLRSEGSYRGLGRGYGRGRGKNGLYCHVC
jgi:IS30 family transposase